MDAFAEIIGYEDVKNELEMICDIIKAPEKYKKLGVNEPKGLLLFGEPGVGKTSMAKCFTEATGRKTFTCRKKKPDGAFINEIVDIFEQAKKATPSIVLLDDMDKYANEDEQHKNAEEFVTLQTCIDDIKNLDVFVLATANALRDVPSSLLRAGRFDKTIEIENPMGEDAEKIIKHYLSKKNFVDEINTKEIAGILNGESCAQLETVINEAGIYAGYANKEKIDMQDMLKACLRVIYRAPEKSKTENIEQIAYHEAGHAVLGELLDPGTVRLVTVQGNHGNVGGFTSQTKPDGYWYSKKLMENRVISLLGGKAAIEVVFGMVDVGAADDLNRAFRIVDCFADDYCANGFENRIQSLCDTSNDLLSRKERQISTDMEGYYGQAKRMLIDNRKGLTAVAEELIREKTITGNRVREIIELCNKHC